MPSIIGNEAMLDAVRLSDEDLRQKLVSKRYPRSGKYSARWLVDNAMGPNPIWSAEALAEVMPLRAGMRVLDMGCGTALTSIFLAREFDVQVWATDLWVKPSENMFRIAEQGVADRVFPVYAEARSLPFAENFFDAVVSFDSYHYYGTDDLYIGYYSRFVKPGGRIGIIVPGLATEQDSLPPPHIAQYWNWDFCAFHSPMWWRQHLEKSGRVVVEVADRLQDGWRDWLQWNEACDQDRGKAGREAEMLRRDAGTLLGFTRVLARRFDEETP
jgi:cyclopropane fatty-acyl-phospholipid synthase-like methyltransferase